MALLKPRTRGLTGARFITLNCSIFYFYFQNRICWPFVFPLRPLARAARDPTPETIQTKRPLIRPDCTPVRCRIYGGGYGGRVGPVTLLNPLRSECSSPPPPIPRQNPKYATALVGTDCPTPFKSPGSKKVGFFFFYVSI